MVLHDDVWCGAPGAPHALRCDTPQIRPPCMPCDAPLLCPAMRPCDAPPPCPMLDTRCPSHTISPFPAHVQCFPWHPHGTHTPSGNYYTNFSRAPSLTKKFVEMNEKGFDFSGQTKRLKALPRVPAWLRRGRGFSCMGPLCHVAGGFAESLKWCPNALVPWCPGTEASPLALLRRCQRVALTLALIAGATGCPAPRPSIEAPHPPAPPPCCVPPMPLVCMRAPPPKPSPRPQTRHSPPDRTT